MINVPITIDYDALEALFGNFGKPTDAVYQQPALQNVSVVAIADPTATTGDTLDGYQVTDTDSISQYGRQASSALVTILNTPNDARTLAEYLQRPAPAYWFSDIRIPFTLLTDAQRDLIATLDLGDYIVVSKRFPNVANPVVENLLVEGIEHRITPSGHVVTLYLSPATVWNPFILNTSKLDDTAWGLEGEAYLELEDGYEMLTEASYIILLESGNC